MIQISTSHRLLKEKPATDIEKTVSLIVKCKKNARQQTG
jgi:hypothetical protein